MIINVHGLASSGDNSKYAWIRDNVTDHEIYSPTFDYEHALPRDILDNISGVARDADYALGSSLGGFFAALLNRIYPHIKAILINPAFVPFLSLGSMEGLPLEMCRRYHELFGLYYYDSLDSYYERGGADNLHVLLGGRDELLRHDVVTKPLLPKGCHIYEIEEGSHRLGFTPEVNDILRSIIK